MFNQVIQKGKVLGKVTNYYWKKEYQLRGAPHYHVLLWIEGAPVIGVDSEDKVLSWIQEKITCNIPDKDTDPELYFLVTRYQMHKCSGYCLRSKKIGNGKYIRRCKFNFPRDVTSPGAVNPIDPSLKTRKSV